jgi:hypothetical protein
VKTSGATTNEIMGCGFQRNFTSTTDYGSMAFSGLTTLTTNDTIRFQLRTVDAAGVGDAVLIRFLNANAVEISAD